MTFDMNYLDWIFVIVADINNVDILFFSKKNKV